MFVVALAYSVSKCLNTQSALECCVAMQGMMTMTITTPITARGAGQRWEEGATGTSHRRGTLQIIQP